jgi:hypothetical protein
MGSRTTGTTGRFLHRNQFELIVHVSLRAIMLTFCCVFLYVLSSGFSSRQHLQSLDHVCVGGLSQQWFDREENATYKGAAVFFGVKDMLLCMDTGGTYLLDDAFGIIVEEFSCCSSSMISRPSPFCTERGS